jgi:hypothetical protein
MNEDSGVGGHTSGLGATQRTDRWWIEPLWTALGFLAFVVYSNWAAFQGEHFWIGEQGVGGYLSPFYSPVLFYPDGAAESLHAHAWLGEWPTWLKSIWPPFMPQSPAWLILAGPMSFRATCYYYRKFYYRSLFLAPPGCAVGPAKQKKYRGETALLLFQNLHRYTWYIAVCFIAILSWDAFVSFWEGGVVGGNFGVGVGSIVLTINPILLGMYTFGCHSCRHLVAGKLNCFSCGLVPKARHSLWQKVTNLNENHMFWAWVSMVWVGLTDVYVRLVSMGVINDLNTW